MDAVEPSPAPTQPAETAATAQVAPVGGPADAATSARSAVRKGSRLRAYLQLMRPGNAVMAAAGGATGLVLAGGSTDLDLVLAATLPPLLIAAFGNVINDLRDLDLDREAHPERPLPSGRVRRFDSWVFAGLLLLAGLAWTQGGGFPAFALAALNALLLGVYEARLKVAGLPGNLLVGLLVGSTFLYGGVVATGGFPRVPMLLLLALVATLTNVAREILKDVEDIQADRGHRRTFPLQFGPGRARLLALAVVNAAVLGTIVAFVHTPTGWWLPWLILLALADAIFLVGACLAWMDVGTAQRLLKLAMLVALAAFLSGPAFGT